MLRTKKASRIARAYLEQFPDLPMSTFAMPRKYLPEEQCRVYEASYGDMTEHAIHTLLIFRVKDTHEVELIEDRREIVRSQLAAKGILLPDGTMRPEGVHTHFMRAIKDASAIFPDWVVRIEIQESATYDVLATLTKPGAFNENLTAPICLFRTNADKAKFFTAFNNDPSKRIGLVVPVESSSVDVRKRLIDQLTVYRKRHRFAA